MHFLTKILINLRFVLERCITNYRQKEKHFQAVTGIFCYDF